MGCGRGGEAGGAGGRGPARDARSGTPLSPGWRGHFRRQRPPPPRGSRRLPPPCRGHGPGRGLRKEPSLGDGVQVGLRGPPGPGRSPARPAPTLPAATLATHSATGARSSREEPELPPRGPRAPAAPSPAMGEGGKGRLPGGGRWGKGREAPQACKPLPSQLFQLSLPPARAGRCNTPLHLPHHCLSPHPAQAHHCSPPPRSRSPACKGVVGRSWGEGEACEFLTLFL